MKNKRLAPLSYLLTAVLVLGAMNCKTYDSDYVDARHLDQEALFRYEHSFFDFWNSLLWHVANHSDAFVKTMLTESSWFYRIPKDVRWGLEQLAQCAHIRKIDQVSTPCVRSEVAATAYALSYIYAGYGHMVWDSSIGVLKRTLNAAGDIINPIQIMTAAVTFAFAIIMDRAYLKYRGMTTGTTKKKLTGVVTLVVNSLPDFFRKRGRDVINKAIIKEVGNVLREVVETGKILPAHPLAGVSGAAALVGAKSAYDIEHSLSLYYFLIKQLSAPLYQPTTMEYRFTGVNKKDIQKAFSGELSSELFNQILQAKIKIAGIKSISDDDSLWQAESILNRMSYTNHYALGDIWGCEDKGNFQCNNLLVEEGVFTAIPGQECQKVVLSRQPLVEQVSDKSYILDLCLLSDFLVVRLPGGSIWMVDEKNWLSLYRQLIALLQPGRVTTYTIID